MAEIGGHSVFTNTNSNNNNGADLLQQAFQQVVDEEENNQENDLVAFLQGAVNGDSQVIHLSAEQAAALGITFKVSDEQPQEISADEFQTDASFEYHQLQEEQEQQQIFCQEDESQNIFDELTQNGLLKSNSSARNSSTFESWSLQQQNQQNEIFNQDSLNTSLNLGTINIQNISPSKQSLIKEQQINNVIHVQANDINQIFKDQRVADSVDSQSNGNTLQHAIHFSLPSSSAQTNSISQSQAQILQKLPMILPSSQYIIKPAQTVLTPVKNFRILSNSSKLKSPSKTSQNSLLLPKTSIVNTIPSQIIKALPVGTQFLGTTNTIPTQFFNSSRLFTKTSDRGSHQMVNEVVTTNVNTIPTITQNLARQTINKAIHQKTQQKGNLQQFFTPILKSTPTIVSSTKNTSLLNTNINKQNVPVTTTKLPTQTIKTLVKTPQVSWSTARQTTTPVISRPTPMIKSDETKSPSAMVTSPMIKTQTPNAAVSILKPQAKVSNSSFNKPSAPTSLLVQKSPVGKPIEISDTMKPLASAKLKQSVNSLMKSIKKKAIPQKLLHQELANANKTTSSTDKPIQIVQQGNSFHSAQRLTPSQIQQIAKVLQQRAMESGNPNEKIVYRLVFPDDTDLKMKKQSLLLKNQSEKNGKRGRPKKGSIKPGVVLAKPVPEEEPQDDAAKEDRKKVMARTRSGRLSRPPRHMVRDYKHLHNLDFTHAEPDDSDGGYSDYTNGNNVNKAEDEDGTGVQRTELLAGLEMPKRKISDHFKCPTCNKIYLGRSRMTRHFEMHPDHGSPDQLPPSTPEPEPKSPPQDPLKRKGKKRGPWAYVTPEAKSERRQLKLREAISVCESSEIAKIAGKPVANSLSLFDFLLLKSNNNVRTFLGEIKELVERIRDKASTMLSVASNEDKHNDDVVDLNEEVLCDVLALNSGFYRVNESVYVEEPETDDRTLNESFDMDGNIEPPLKMPKTNGMLEEVKENLEERLSSGFSESSDLSMSDFLNERRNDSSITTMNCPEVLSALTLMPRNNSSSPITDVSTKVNIISNVLNSGAEVQTTDNPGFQKLSINVSSKNNSSFMKEGEFTKLGDSLDSSCSNVFTKLNGSYDQAKLENLQRTFIKLKPQEDGFIKLENGMLGAFHEEIEDFGKIQNNGFHYISSSTSDGFHSNKGFRKLVPKAESTVMVPTNEDMKIIDDNKSHIIDENSLHITTSSHSNNVDSNIFVSTDNLDISKIDGYDHITHLDILNSAEHLHLVDNSNIVDEIVSERLKSMMPENLLESNLLHSNNNLDTDLDFDEISEEFNRNTRS